MLGVVVFPHHKEFIAITKSIRNSMTPTLELIGGAKDPGRVGRTGVILITHMLITNIYIIFIYRLYWTLTRMQTGPTTIVAR